MKLKELITALAHEVESVRPELVEQLDALATMSLDDPEFVEKLGAYTEQTQRVGEALGYAGFAGLEMVSQFVAENAMLLATLEPSEREDVIAFLLSWPELLIFYLENLDDSSAAAGLMDLLRIAPYPMDEDSALKIMHVLGALPPEMLETSDEDKKLRSNRPVLAREEDLTLNIPDDVEQRLMEGFLQEAPQHAQKLLQLVRKMTTGSVNTEDLTAAKRSAHTLKGSSSIIGLRAITTFSHNLEDILEFFEESGGKASPTVANILLDGAYCLEQMVAYVTSNDDYPQQALPVLQNILDLANSIDNGEPLENISKRTPSSNSAPLRDEKAPQQAPQQTTTSLRVNVEQIEQLFRVAAEVSVHSSALEARIKILRDNSRRLVEQNIRLKTRLFELETLVDIRALALMRNTSKRSTNHDFDPLEMEQYNELYSTAHALVEETNDAMLLAQGMENDVTQLLSMQNKQQVLSGDLQHLVTSTRMAEVNTLESRLQRNVRNTAQATGKQALLYINGGNTLIDNDVLSRLAEPLLHILRNAVDHGIEAPEVRAAAGKDETGKITLDFSRQGQQVVLRCSDDGGGIDPKSILQKAVQKNIVNEEQNLSDEDIIRLILLPGFSTKDEVSEVSGRGVGLDVVVDWVHTMGGRIDIRATVGKGTLIELSFAATLTSSHSLIIATNGQYFALPSAQIKQSVSKTDGVFSYDDENLQYTFKDEIYAASFLAETVALPVDRHKPLSEYDAVIITLHNQNYVLAVDRLVDSKELLVETNNRYLRHVASVAGTSILGDGSIAVQLDIQQILSDVKRFKKFAFAVNEENLNTLAGKRQLPRILIVDDSLSVRNTLQELVGDAGFETLTARDGIDAIGKLDNFKPELLLTDLEMPNMNGVELTTHIRSRNDLASIPIIMVTSRSQDKHRELAFKAGVDSYITKPYNESELLRTINQSLNANS